MPEYYFTKPACRVSKLVREIERAIGRRFADNRDGYITYMPPILKIVSFKPLSPLEESLLKTIVEGHTPKVYLYLAYREVETEAPVSGRKMVIPTDMEVLEFDEPQDTKELEKRLGKKVRKYEEPFK